VEVARRFAQAYADDDAAAQWVEGLFDRSLAGSEYVRGIYFPKMPDYKDENFLGIGARSPNFYWTGEPNIELPEQSIDQTVDMLTRITFSA